MNDPHAHHRDQPPNNTPRRSIDRSVLVRDASGSTSPPSTTTAARISARRWAASGTAVISKRTTSAPSSARTSRGASSSTRTPRCELRAASCAEALRRVPPHAWRHGVHHVCAHCAPARALACGHDGRARTRFRPLADDSMLLPRIPPQTGAQATATARPIQRASAPELEINPAPFNDEFFPGYPATAAEAGDDAFRVSRLPAYDCNLFEFL
jgi:hypothetical protein